MKLTIFSFLFVSLIAYSCDFFTGLEGKVIDETNGTPIVNAHVGLLNDMDATKTNNEGYFDVRCRTGLRLLDPEIMVTKDGYKPFQIKIKRAKDQTSYIVKSETFFMKFERPFYPDSLNKSTFLTGTWINKWSQKFLIKDTLTIYLSRDDINSEMEDAKIRFRKK